MAFASVHADRYILLRFHIRNLPLHWDNEIQVFLPSFSGKGQESRRHCGPGKYPLLQWYSLSTAICTLYPDFNWALRIWSSFMCMNVASGSVLE